MSERKIEKILLLFLTLSGISLYGEEPINSWEKVKTEIHHLSKTEKVFIDNIYIQSYAGKLGIWKKTTYGVSLDEIAKPYGSTPEDVIQINNLPRNTQKIFNMQWIFVPYSEKFTESLEKSGFMRMTWDVAKDEYIWPVEGVRITSRLGQRWGKLGPGVDIATPTGSLVLASNGRRNKRC